MTKITPFLWFNDNAREAMRFYASIFPDSAALNQLDFEGSDTPFFSGTYVLAGQEVMVLNGGPHHQLNEAFSFFIHCEDQAEVDRYWDALVDGGRPTRCGWLTDRFGVTWQVIPKALGQYLGDADRAKATRVQEAMLKMVKIDVSELRKAYEGV